MPRRKTTGRDFVPGDPRINREGRPKLPEELKEIRRMTRGEVELRILELWDKPEPEIKTILDDPKTSLRDKMIMRVMLRAIAKGDHAGLGFIMDTTFGKQTQKIDMQVRPFSHLSDQDLDVQLKKAENRGITTIT